MICRRGSRQRGWGQSTDAESMRGGGVEMIWAKVGIRWGGEGYGISALTGAWAYAN